MTTPGSTVSSKPSLAMKLSTLFLVGVSLVVAAAFADETLSPSAADAAANGVPAADTIPRLVGRLGRAHDLDFAGNDSFPANGLRKALAQDLTFVLASHPSETLDSLLGVINERLRAGYLAAGFPDAAIRASCHGAGDDAKIRVSITEGQRFRQGNILVSGGPEIDRGQLIAALQNHSPKDGVAAFAQRIHTLMKAHEEKLGASAANQRDGKQAATDQAGQFGSSGDAVADWQPGKPVAFESGGGQPLLDRVEKCLADQGRPLARVTTAHERHADGTVDLQIHIEDPGPAAVIGTLTVDGHHANPAEEILQVTGLAPGQPFTPRRLDEATVALWRTGRFFPFVIDIHPRGDNRSEIDLHLRVRELPGVPPLATATTPEQDTVLRFIDWLNHGLPGGELLIESRASAKSRWGFGLSSDEVVGDLTLPDGGTSASVILSKQGASFSLCRDGRSRAVSFDRFADKLVANLQLLPSGEEVNPLAISTQVGFSSSRNTPFNIDLLVTPALVFFADHRIRREQEQVIVTIANTDLSLVLDGVTGRPVAARTAEMDCNILTTPGSVRQRGEALTAEIAKLHPARSAVGLWDAYRELLKWFFPSDNEQADDKLFDGFRRTAGLFDLVARPEVLAPLKDWFADYRAAKQGEDKFEIPASAESFSAGSTMNLLVGFGCVWMAEEYLPDAAWLATFARELLFIHGGKTEHTRAVMDSLIKDPAIGPVGCMACARLLDGVDPGTALRFRRKAREQADAGAFREDWKVFLNTSTPLGVSLGRSLEAIAAFSAADESKAAELLPAGMSDWLREFRRELRQRPAEQAWSEAIVPSMDRLWNDHLGASLREELERRIPPPADPAETAATVDGVAVPRFLVKVLADQHRGPLRALQLPDRDEARPWTTDPALACAVRSVLLSNYMKENGRYPSQEQIDAFLRTQFPDLDGKPDGDWLAEIGMTRSQIGALAVHVGVGPAFLTEMHGALEASPDEQVLRDYYKERESTYAVRVDADLAFVTPPGDSRPAQIKRCYQQVAKLGEILSGGKSAAEVQDSGVLDEMPGAQVLSRTDADLSSFQFAAAKALAKLQPGEATEPMPMGNGIVVLVLRASSSDRAPAFEEVRDTVLEHWQAEELEAATRQWFETRESHADIQVLEAPATSGSR